MIAKPWFPPPALTRYDKKCSLLSKIKEAKYTDFRISEGKRGTWILTSDQAMKRKEGEKL